MNEVNRIIEDLKFCDSVFDYTLTPDDSGLLLGYIKELQQENQQLKLTNQALSSCLKIDKEKIDYYVDRCEQLEKVLDEIRELASHFSGGQICDCSKELGMKIEEILDKVKE